VYSNLAESLLDVGPSMDNLTSSTGMMSMIALIVSVLNTLCLFWMFRHLNSLILTNTIARQVHALAIEYVSTTTKSPYKQFVEELKTNLRYVHLILFLCVFQICVVLLVLKRLGVFVRRPSYLNSHISNGLEGIELV